MKPIKTVYQIFNTTEVIAGLFPITVIFFFTIIFFSRLFYPEINLFMIPDFGESDVIHLNLPFKEFLSRSLKSLQWPLWNPDLGGGFPQLAEGQTGTFFLPNLLLFRFLDFQLAYNLGLLVSFLISFWGMYFLLRFFKLGIYASTFGAIVYAYSGFVAVHLNHYNLIQAASLTPWVILAFQRLIIKPYRKQLLFYSLIVSQQIFAGHNYITFISLLGGLLFLLATISLNSKKEEIIKNIRNALILFLSGSFLAVCLSGIQIIPTYELFANSTRSNGLSFETVTSYPYPPSHLVTFVNPYYFGSPANGTYKMFSTNWGIFWENTAYIGLLPLAFALLSFVKFRNRNVLAASLMLFFSILLVFGKYSPVYLIFSFPPFNWFRVPSKFLILSVIFLVFLASFFFDLIIYHLKKNKLQIFNKPFLFLIFLSIFFDVFRFSYEYPPISSFKNWLSPKLPETKVINNINGRILSLGMQDKWNQVFLNKGWKNIDEYLQFCIYLFPNYNSIFRIPSIEVNTGGLRIKRPDLANGITSQYKIDNNQIVNFSQEAEKELNMLSVSHIITSYGIGNKNYKLIYENSNLSDMPKIYQNQSFRPFAYLSGKTTMIATVEAYMRFLTQLNDFDKQNPVAIEDKALEIETQLGNKPPIMPEIIRKSVQEISLKTQSDSKMVLAISQNNYPGWTVKIDGQPERIYSVNINQVGIPVEKGNHSVLLSYKPNSFILGKLLTLASSLTTLLMAFRQDFSVSHTNPNKRKRFFCP